jgi:signal transduction histidine kinase
MRRLPVGLHARLVLALVATGVLTLAVAALTLLTPLERQLRRDEIESVVRQASFARDSLARLDPKELPAGSREVHSVLRSLGRRANTQVSLVDARGRVVAGTDVDPGEPSTAAAQAIAANRVVEQVAGDDLRIGVPVRTEAGRYGLEMRKTLDDVSAAAAVVRRAMTTAAIAGLGVALLVGVGLAGRLVRRLRALRNATLKVAQLGPVIEMPPDHTRDEIGDLSRSFAVMQERLREQEEARRTFVGTASHELRTPLTSLRLMLDLLHEELGNPEFTVEAAREQVDQARAQSDRLGALAAQLLDLSRLDAGVPLRRELIELREESRAVIAEFAARSAETGRAVKLHGDGAVWVTADPGAVAQILRVLLDNALRFAPTGTPVEVTLTDGAEAALRVSDRGPGVPAAEREEIFERFRRGSTTGGSGGFGLGLAIARELARRMEGDVVVGTGETGACFELHLRPAPRA